MGVSEVFCQQCGAQNAAGARFCSACGQPIVTEVPGASPPAQPTPIVAPTDDRWAIPAHVKNSRGLPRWAIAALIIGGLVVLGVLGSQGKSSSPQVADQAAPPAVATADTPDPTATPEIATSPLTIGGLRYTIGPVRTASTYGPEFDLEHAAGEYVVVALTVRNVGKEPADISGSDFQLERGDTKFDSASVTVGEDHGFFLTKLNPGTEKTGSLVFDVPANTAPSKYHIIVFGNGSGGNQDSAKLEI